MRVVVDTNVLVSFAIHPSAAFEKIFDHIAAHGVTLVSEATVSELFSVLQREKFRRYLPLDAVVDYVEWYAGISEFIGIVELVVACRDPRDDQFLEVAINGRADWILSGDADLLALDPFRGVRIIEPGAFVSLISPGG